MPAANVSFYEEELKRYLFKVSPGHLWLMFKIRLFGGSGVYPVCVCVCLQGENQTCPSLRHRNYTVRQSDVLKEMARENKGVKVTLCWVVSPIVTFMPVIHITAMCVFLSSTMTGLLSRNAHVIFMHTPHTRSLKNIYHTLLSQPLICNCLVQGCQDPEGHTENVLYFLTVQICKTW